MKRVFWLLVAGFLVFGFGYWAGAVRLIPLPIPDTGNGIFLVGDGAWTDVIRALEPFGVHPIGDLSTERIRRVIMSNGTMIDATVDPILAEYVEGVGGGFALVVDDPVAQAKNFSARLTVAGYPSNCIANPDPELPLGALAVVRSRAFPYGFVVFRRHALQMGQRPKPWNPQD